MKTKAISYLRVSTKAQESEGGFPRQRENIQRFADRNDYKVVAEFSEDVSARAKLEDRPVMSEAIEFMTKNDIVFMLVESSDRFARDEYAHISIKEKLKDLKKDCIYCDSGSKVVRGKMTWVEDGMSTTKTKDQKERTRAGKYTGVENKGIPGHAFTPYGYEMQYEVNERGKQTNRSLKIIPARAKIIRQIFKRYASGKHSLKSIMDWLNENEVPTASDLRGWDHPRRKAKSGWRRATIRKILRNTVYMGKYTYGRKQIDEPETYSYIPEQIELDTPPIVDLEIWDKVQKRLEQNVRDKPSSPEYPLRGRMRCKKCGNTLRKKSTKYAVYYECNWHKNSENKCDPRVRARIERVDRTVALTVIDIMADPQKLEEEFEARRVRAQKTNRPITDQIEEINVEIEHLETKLDRFAELYADLSIDKDQYTKFRGSTLGEIQSKETERERLQELLEPVPSIDLDIVSDAIKDIELDPTMTDEEKKQDIEEWKEAELWSNVDWDEAQEFKTEWFDRLRELRAYVLRRTRIAPKRRPRVVEPKPAVIEAYDRAIKDIYEQLNIEILVDFDEVEIFSNAKNDILLSIKEYLDTQ